MTRTFAPLLLVAALGALAGCRSQGGWRLEPGPHAEAYKPYVADPRRARVGVTGIAVLDDEIEDAGEARWRLQAGATAGLLRWTDEGDPARIVQLDAEAGFSGEFDLEDSNDSIGWDGIYGFLVAWRNRPEVGWRVGAHHVSSHIGDEFADETGRERINATREELLAGVSRLLGGGWRTYAEAGWAYHVGNYDLLDRWRLQTGLEYESPRTWWRERLGWYAAGDVSSYEEDEWEPNLTLQWGFALERAPGLDEARLGLELYSGRARMGEFFEERETALGIGLWL